MWKGLLMNNYLYDFRESIVKRKRDKKFWNDWDKWNILYKTLVFELSGSKDVESYVYVRKVVFGYFDRYEEYVGSGVSLDIMNGWWFCFKILFGVNESRINKKTRNDICTFMKKIQYVGDNQSLIDKIREEYPNLGEKVIRLFIEYLEVVYTIGNITPVPKGGNVHADIFDSWEYKLFFADSVKYAADTDYMKYFLFEEYKIEDKWWVRFKSENDKIQIVSEYMESRIELIKNRGKKITEETWE